MQLVKQEYVKGEGGSLTLVADTGEDLWHVYNLVAAGDQLRAATIRKVTRETSTGSQESQRMRLTLTVEVVDVEYDPEGGMMRVRGKNRTETPHVRLGSFHTLELELNRKFTLTKALWDEVDVQVDVHPLHATSAFHDAKRFFYFHRVWGLPITRDEPISIQDISDWCSTR